ncbi:hypothetical protein Ancab_039259 [Ancistrocladus abbreviatus]
MEGVGDRLVSKIGEKTNSKTSYADVVRGKQSDTSGRRLTLRTSGSAKHVDTWGTKSLHFTSTFNRKASVSLESGTGRNITGNNSPDQVSAKAEDVISEFQSPINDVLRQPEEEDNGEATLLKATDREVGQLRSASAEYAHGDKEHATGSYPINDKLNLFPEEVGSGGLKNGFRNMDLSASE